ncbi:ABC transporter substrate-binding protein [Streptomyces zingiberis]|uniref:Sugar ABC transporter substrate-binding protein n=1 Tax=Streptomyces zingiberis TaxID=2053010 RepID=A0ABX1C287_9ACTN|nr:sugar ABC transporter substrate-binding protein [Streptomyces zingiberis]NJQ02795.1 sugar ABC transporter substrate-binding protein [Streptomyces zingiberis]
MRTGKSRKLLAAAVVTAVTTLLVPACSAGGPTAQDGGKVTLRYWAWAPGSAEEVKEFNRTHPDIKVVHTDAGGGDQSSAKLLAAHRAGNAPDLALVENPSLPRMIVAGAVADITDRVAEVKKEYAPGSWAQTTFNGRTYALPQDVGPMALLYRKDVFDKYGVEAPLTWDDYREAAAAIKKRDPDLTMASLSTDNWDWFAAVAAQAGDDWWSIDGDRWTVGIDGENSRKVMEFFQGMYEDGLVATDPILTPTYNQKLNDGTMLSWPSAVWAPGVVHGVAPKTAGKWALAPLPRWDEDDPTVSFQGGSSVAVTAGSEHPEEAAEFAKWLNASDKGAKMILNVQNAYPAALSGQKAAIAQKPPALMPQQSDYYETVAGIARDTRPVTWGPNTDVAASAFTDALNDAIRNGTSWADVLTVTEKAVVADLKKQEFEVDEG